MEEQKPQQQNLSQESSGNSSGDRSKNLNWLESFVVIVITFIILIFLLFILLFVRIPLFLYEFVIIPLLFLVPLMFFIFFLIRHSKRRQLYHRESNKIRLPSKGAIAFFISIIWAPLSLSVYPIFFFDTYRPGLSLGPFLDAIIKIPGFLPNVILSPLHKIEAGFSLAIILGPILWFSEFYAAVYLVDRLISIFKTRGKAVSFETSESIKPTGDMNLKRSLPSFGESKEKVQFPTGRK